MLNKGPHLVQAVQVLMISFAEWKRTKAKRAHAYVGCICLPGSREARQTEMIALRLPLYHPRKSGRSRGFWNCALKAKQRQELQQLFHRYHAHQLVYLLPPFLSVMLNHA